MPSDLSARVERVSPSLESPLYAVVELTVANAGSATGRVSRFAVQWPGGEVQYDPKNLVVAPGGTARRTVHVGPDRGDVASLLAAGGAVRVVLLLTN